MRKLFMLWTMVLGLTAQAKINVIPQPTDVWETGLQFRLANGQSIGYTDATLRPAALYLQDVLTRATGMKISTRRGEGTFTLTLKNRDAKDDSYRLDVTTMGVRAEAHNYRGITNAIATIRQLLPEQIESQEVVKGIAWVMPTLGMRDIPNYDWRGLMLDPVRHFYSIEETKRLIDQMALYKFNKFHWHLIDDQAWRLQIRRYPELTQVGAYRKPDIDIIDTKCMERAQSESNPDFILPRKFFKTINGEKMYGGYYTQEEVREVVRYAAQRGVDVVPEIDMPGHNHCAQRAFPWLSCTGQPNSVYCLGTEATMEFARNIFREVFQLFPYEFVHIGGDEVNREVWKGCEKCQARIRQLQLAGVEELQAWFTREMEQYFHRNGRKLLGWEEILDGGVSQTATICWWRGDHPDITQRSTAMGNHVVVCPFSYCYFDYGQDNGTLQRIYDGDIVPTDLNEAQQRLIRGIQGNIWGEWIPTEARMQFMTFPRALALAEKAWTPRPNQHWEDFLPRLKQHLKRLEVMKVNYRPLVTDKP